MTYENICKQAETEVRQELIQGAVEQIKTKLRALYKARMQVSKLEQEVTQLKELHDLGEIETKQVF